jgi:hypothetical protein
MDTHEGYLLLPDHEIQHYSDSEWRGCEQWDLYRVQLVASGNGSLDLDIYVAECAPTTSQRVCADGGEEHYCEICETPFDSIPELIAHDHDDYRGGEPA